MMKRRVCVRHAGVVQQNHIRPAPILALAEIRRWQDVGNDARVGRKSTTRHFLHFRGCPDSDKAICREMVKNAGLLP
jgi:hypothetical protein